MRIIISLLISIALWSCSKEVELDQPSYTRRIVVDGWIETGQPAQIFLTYSSPFLTSYDSASIRATFINYAKITITSSAGDSEIMTLFREKDFPSICIQNSVIKGQTGVRYDLKVEVKGQTITATTTIPQPPSVQKLWLDLQTDSTGYLNAGILPDPDQSTFLYTQVKSLKCEENFHASFTPCYQVLAGGASLTLPIWRTRETNLYLSDLQTYYYTGWPKYEYATDDTILVKIGTIDSTSFKVLKSIYNDQINKDNPFAFYTNGITTNINGGIGRWTGIGVDKTMIWIK